MTRNGIVTGFQKAKHQLMPTREELLLTSPLPTKLLTKPTHGENLLINTHSLYLNKTTRNGTMTGKPKVMHHSLPTREELLALLLPPTLVLMPKMHGENPPTNIHSLYPKDKIRNGTTSGRLKVMLQSPPTKEELPPLSPPLTLVLMPKTHGENLPTSIHSL